MDGGVSVSPPDAAEDLALEKITLHPRSSGEAVRGVPLEQTLEGIP